MEGIGEYQQESGVGTFALKSGNSSSLPFKEMGSSPAKFGLVASQALAGNHPNSTQAGMQGGTLMGREAMNSPAQDPKVMGGEVPQHGPESHMKGKMNGKMWGGVGGTSGGQDAFEAMSMKDFSGMERGARKEYMGGLSTEDKRTQMKNFMPKMPNIGTMFGGMFG